MMRGKLADYFTGVGAKRVKRVEDKQKKGSHQHEINTTRQMRESFLGTEKRVFGTVYGWLGDEEDSIRVEGTTTYYDTREKDPKRRPEWRLYYEPNPVTEAMREGDCLFLAHESSGRLWFIVGAQGSSSERQLCWLFDLWPEGNALIYRGVAASTDDLNFSARYTLNELGIEIQPVTTDRQGEIVREFGGTFPPTTEFSKYARNSMPEVEVLDDPDGALLAWIEREWENYRLLETADVRRQLMGLIKQLGEDSGDANVDVFIEYFLGLHNRRKSRMGHSLEHHMAAVLDAFGISYTRGAMTENRNRPDFLFPSEDIYHEAADDAPALMMLGAKSTCKDRWRQVLTEADKIRCKHLLTLQPGISELQTEQMEAAGVQLVVPLTIQLESYTPSQRKWVWSVRDFVEEAQRRQSPVRD